MANTYIEKARPNKEHLINSHINKIDGSDGNPPLNCDITTLFGLDPIGGLDRWQPVVCDNTTINFEINKKTYKYQNELLKNCNKKYLSYGEKDNNNILKTNYITRCIDLDLMCDLLTDQKDIITLYNKQKSLYTNQRKIFWLTLCLRGHKIENRDTDILTYVSDLIGQKIYINHFKPITPVIFMTDGEIYSYNNYSMCTSDKNIILDINTYSDNTKESKGVPMLNIFIDSLT